MYLKLPHLYILMHGEYVLVALEIEGDLSGKTNDSVHSIVLCDTRI